MAIFLSSQFRELAGLPIEEKMVMIDLTARDAIPTIERYDGLFSYVVAEQKTYQLQGGITNSDWVEIGGATGITPGVQYRWTWEELQSGYFIQSEDLGDIIFSKFDIFGEDETIFFNSLSSGGRLIFTANDGSWWAVTIGSVTEEDDTFIVEILSDEGFAGPWEEGTQFGVIFIPSSNFYSQSFVIDDWVLNGEFYELEINHNLGRSVNIIIYDSSNAVIDVNSIEKVGDDIIKLQVYAEKPDDRFDGSLLIN